MREAGLIDRWRSQWWRPPTSCPSTHSGSARAMHMTSLTGIFLVVVSLSLVALFMFSIEYYMFKNRRKSYITNWLIGWVYQHPLESNKSRNQAVVHNCEMRWDIPTKDEASRMGMAITLSQHTKHNVVCYVSWFSAVWNSVQLFNQLPEYVHFSWYFSWLHDRKLIQFTISQAMFNQV